MPALTRVPTYQSTHSPPCLPIGPRFATAEAWMSETTEKQSDRQRALRVPIVPAPKLPYEPRDPKRYRPGIALIGCGGITKWHLRAYKDANYKIVALCDMVK